MSHGDFWVDDAAHLLHLGGRIFPCDREIVAALPWKGHALLLSTDTDCLSLWDADGLIRLTRVGVYPQDVALQDDMAYVCGGADGRLHIKHLPDLYETAEYPLPGMPERLCVAGDHAYVLTLLPEPEVHTGLLTVRLATGRCIETAEFTGIPEAITADKSGLWIAVSDGVIRLLWTDLRA